MNERPSQAPASAERSPIARRRVPSGPRGRERVERILAAAEVLLARQAPGEITAAAIVDEAGISIGSFYQYFANATAALAAVLQRRGERVDARTIEVIEASHALPWREAIDRIVDSVFESYGRIHDEPTAQLVSRSFVPSPAFQRLARESTARVTRALHAHPKLVAALPDAGRRWLVARTTVEACTGVQGWAFRPEQDDHPVDPAAVAEEIKSLVKAYLGRYLEESP